MSCSKQTLKERSPAPPINCQDNPLPGWERVDFSSLRGSYQDPTRDSENLPQAMSMYFKRITKRFLRAAVLASLLTCGPVWAQEPEVTYSVDTSQLQNNRLVVTATIPASAFPGDERVIALPVWTPGSYKVRDYSRFLGEVQLLNGGGSIEKISKNRWRVSGLSQDAAVSVRYSVYGHELSVRTNYFDPEFALVIGAATFVAPAPLTSANGRRADFKVQFPDWKGDIATGLDQPSPGEFQASDYDRLVDSPLLLGDLKIEDLQTSPRPSRIVTAGPHTFWSDSTYLQDVRKIVQTIEDFWQSVPYEEYTFMNLITGTRGGLEHINSTVVMGGPYTALDRKTYLDWLGTMSHEHFHVWNVKSLRPTSLSEFDYERENYTSALWIAEGFTSYYDSLLIRRAGVCTDGEYLEHLANELYSLQTTPGRKAITMADASWDAWIRLYQESDDLHNSNVSYYGKGAVVAWLLDTKIRQSTGGKRSLDDVMRLAYKRFTQTGYEPKQMEALASEVAGVDLTSFFRRAVYSTEELPIDEALAYWGLKWDDSEKKSKPYLGATVSERNGRAVITRVDADSPAYKAGLAAGDEVLGIDGNRLPPGEPLGILQHFKLDGRSHKLLISRLSRISEKIIVLATEPTPKRKLVFTEANESLKARRLSWLGPEKGTAP